MNNGIISFAPSGTVDSRTLLGILPLNSNVLNSCSSPYNYPAPNNQYEGYYNRNDYVCVVDTTVNNNLTVTMGLVLAQGGFLTIDWGDGSYGGIVNSVNMQRNGSFETVFIVGGSSVFNLNHTYPRHGQYIVRFIGIAATSVASTRIGLTNNSQNLTHILSFGKNNGLTTCLIQGNTNLIYVPDSAPPQHLGNYGDNGGMFTGSSKFNHPNISQWNLNNNTSLASMFGNCTSFNRSINNLIVNSGTSCSQMFTGCSSLTDATFNNWIFNGNNDCASMFINCSTFIGNGLNSWNTNGITNMASMFRNAASFNQPLNNWNVRKVTDFSSMFQGAAGFNSSLSGWALGADTTGTTCFSMFQSASSFNQNISNWDTSKVTSMASMFRGAASFNQPIGSWNVSNVTSMNQIFNSLSPNAGPPFTQDISSWDIRKVVNMDFMFTGGTNTWGTTNYSNALIAWAALPDTNLNSQAITAFAASSTNTLVTSNNHGLVAGSRVNITGTTNYNGDYNVVSVSNVNQFVISKTFVTNDATGTMNHRRSRNVVAGFGSNKYSAGAAADARNVLINTYGWTITDGGQA